MIKIIPKDWHENQLLSKKTKTDPYPYKHLQKKNFMYFLFDILIKHRIYNTDYISNINTT